MDRYAQALKAHLDGDSRQQDFAEKIGKRQASVSRYVTGERFPDADTARQIDIHSAGSVPFSLWQSEMLRRLGIAA